MSQQTQDHAEYIAALHEQEWLEHQLDTLNELYGPFKPVVKRYRSDDIEEGKVSRVAAVATAHTANKGHKQQ